jgi:hypothetical protein
VLDGEKHRRLIARREEFAKDARITTNFIWEPLPAKFSERERHWLQKFKSHRTNGHSGLVVTGVCEDVDPLTRFGRMAGFLTRNCVRARVFPLNEVVDTLNEGGTIEATCLLIPDFVIDVKDKSAIKNWRIQQLTQMLIDRWSAGGLTQTVLYAPTVASIKNEYGAYVTGLIKNHYLHVSA